MSTTPASNTNASNLSYSILEEYESYAKWVSQAYAMLKEHRESGTCETDVLSSPMYTRYYRTKYNNNSDDTHKHDK